MAYSYSKISVESDWNESVINNEASKLSLFHDSEDTGAKSIISCQVFNLASGMGGLLAVENQDNRFLCGLSTILVVRSRKVTAERGHALYCVKVTTFDEKFTTNIVANASNIEALNPSNDAAFRVPLSYKMLREHDCVTLTLLNDSAKLGEGVVPCEDIQYAEDGTMANDFRWPVARQCLLALCHAAQSWRNRIDSGQCQLHWCFGCL